MDNPTDATVSFTEQPSIASSVNDSLGTMLDSIAEVDRSIARLEALKAELVAQAAEWNEVSADLLERDRSSGMVERSFRAELAAVIRVPERTAENLIGNSRFLIRHLPATSAALLAGEISLRHAQVLIENAAGLEDGAIATLEAQALPFARTVTAARFERKVRTLRELAVPESLTERKKKAAEDRELRFDPARDGMAYLTAYLPAEQALAIYNRITDIARGLQCPDEERTLTQLRADVFRDLAVDGAIYSGTSLADAVWGIRPTIFVTVPALTLLDRSDEPAILDGYGPIDANTAKELCANAPSFVRLLTHPETGAVLSLGRDSYRVPQDLKNWLRARDGTCRFPGCSRATRFCDIDHSHDWARNGTTEHANLAHLCPGHHTVKHASNWAVEQSPNGDGTLHWTSPTGHEFTTEPETRIGV